jgi:ribonuclease BN (tRNA processing enzyme)
VRIRILGCHGGELPDCKTTCFLIDERIAFDAGALTASLGLELLAQVDHIILSHSHFDHVKDLPLLADLMVGLRKKPVTVHASLECTQTLRNCMFNDRLWPDFTRIPNARNPVIKFEPFRVGSRFKVGKYAVRSVLVSHPVESCGFVISDRRSAVAISGDTGPTDSLWTLVNQTQNLKALVLETSFPNRLQALADISGHLTPQTLRGELAKFKRNGAAVLLYHLKPAFLRQLKKELGPLPVELLEAGDTFDF